MGAVRKTRSAGRNPITSSYTNPTYDSGLEKLVGSYIFHICNGVLEI